MLIYIIYIWISCTIVNWLFMFFTKDSFCNEEDWQVGLAYLISMVIAPLITILILLSCIPKFLESIGKLHYWLKRKKDE